MAVSDDKQNRLSTLTQDVIAVPKKPAAPAQPSRKQQPPAPEVRAKPIPPTQDVFVAPEPPPPQPPPVAPPRAPAPAAAPVMTSGTATSGAAMPRASRPRQPAVPDNRLQMLAYAAVAAASLALAIALYAVLAAGEVSGGGVDDAALAKLSADLAAANERIGRLEGRLSTAESDAQKLGAPGQGNVLQLSAGMRELRDDLDAVSNDLAGVTAQIGELRTLAGNASGQAKTAASQVEQVASRVATLNEQVAGLPKGGGSGGGAVSGDVSAQLKSLTAKTDKMAADIRQLYRQVGAQ